MVGFFWQFFLGSHFHSFVIRLALFTHASQIRSYASMLCNNYSYGFSMTIVMCSLAERCPQVTFYLNRCSFRFIFLEPRVKTITAALQENWCLSIGRMLVQTVIGQYLSSEWNSSILISRWKLLSFSGRKELEWVRRPSGLFSNLLYSSNVI